MMALLRVHTGRNPLVLKQETDTATGILQEIQRENLRKMFPLGEVYRLIEGERQKRVPSKSGQGDKGDYNGEDMSLKDSAKLGFGVGAGLLGFNLTLLGIATVGGFLLNRD